MDQKLLDELKSIIRGEILTDDATLMTFSHDASLFEVKPQVVVQPKDVADVEALVVFVEKHKKEHPELSLTGRAAGTDMSGGSVNDSILVAFGPHFHDAPKIDVKGRTAVFQPGMFYRDFEKETLKHDLIFPSYPASRELCAMGGIVNNNSGGEKSLRYGKTEQYINRVNLVLRDGKVHTFVPLTERELAAKMQESNIEGEIYTKMYKLISENYEQIMKAKPIVHKNSAGYYLWNVWDREKKIFDLVKLIVGAQGTLGLMTEAEAKLVPVEKHREMMVIFLYDLDHLGEIISQVLPLDPESFESYDDNTLKLALKFFPEFAKYLGAQGLVETGMQFLPEFLMVMTGGLPKLVLQVDFTGDDPAKLAEKVAELQRRLAPLHPKTRIAIDDGEKKYWVIRRDSFNLLRQKIKDKHTAPFIDDFSVKPEYLGEFLPKLNKIFEQYHGLIYTVAGHVGDGNFHIIPLMTIEDPATKPTIEKLSKEVYDLVLQYHGTITSEHNDGLIRTPFLRQMYGDKICELFAQTKAIFDPDNIFNPRKKVNADWQFAMDHIREHW